MSNKICSPTDHEYKLIKETFEPVECKDNFDHTQHYRKKLIRMCSECGQTQETYIN